MKTRTSRRNFLKSLCAVSASMAFTGCAGLSSRSKINTASKPNIVFIMTDDLGYADLSCYGNKEIKTPNLDKMAKEGMLFTDFHSNGPLCTPTRASLVTGCYQQRVSMYVAPDDERYTQVKTMPNKEVTFGEVMKSAGYKTALVGKWHLGDHKPYLPVSQGFDLYYGLPYSNDMNPWTPKRVNRPDLPFIRQQFHIEYNPNQDYLTRRYTYEATRFIKENRDRPFFLYLPHSMPHKPVHASKFFAPEGRFSEEKMQQIDKDHPEQSETRNFLYPACIEELDWSTGKILDTLKELDIAENTLVIFTSDNGPSTGGSAGPLKGKKGSIYEGGHRVPFIAWWPGKIKPNTKTDEISFSMDMLPTMAKLADAQLPEKKLDGIDITKLLLENRKLPERTLFMERKHMSFARKGKFKLVELKPRKNKKGKTRYELYNLETDIGEKNNIAEKHPQIVQNLKKELMDWKEYVKPDRPPQAW